jgi:hypothetical protein
MSPSAIIRVLLVGTIPGARPATCDPALDLAKTSPEALTRYERERSDEARAALAIIPDATPALFEVRPLTASALRWVRSADDGETVAHRAFLASCHRYTDSRGVEHAAKVEKPGLFEVAPDAWLDEVFAEYGDAAVREVAKVALDRAEAGPRALAPFALPRGLMLPR